MKTHKKITSQLLTTLLILIMITPTLFTFLSTIPTPVYASVGAPKLGVSDAPKSIVSFQIATYNVSLQLDNINATKIDGKTLTLSPPHFTIFFGDYNVTSKNTTTWYVTFLGAQFSLYISKDGYSQISPDDKLYAGPFNVADLRTGNKSVTVNTPLGPRTFYIGNITISSKPNYKAYYVLVGPISASVPKDYKFIKVFDGSTTSVAVSTQTIDILASLFISPKSGGAGTPVTLTGVAFPANTVVELNYTAVNTPIKERIGYVTTDANGTFTLSFPIKDAKVGLTTNPSTLSPTTITIGANSTSPGEFDVFTTFTEYPRAFVMFRSWDPTGTQIVDSATPPYYGNNTVTLKNMETGSQEELKPEQVVEKLSVFSVYNPHP